MYGMLGVLGIAISAVAYVPQVLHLARERCSAGVSSRAWGMWLASSVLVGVVAVRRRDPIFILLQLCTFISAVLILGLARRYRGMRCGSHPDLAHRVLSVGGSEMPAASDTDSFASEVSK